MCKVRKAAASDCFYGVAAEFAAAFIEAECDFLNVNIGPELLNLREVDPLTDANIDCGAEESCPGSGNSELVQIHSDDCLRGRSK